MDLLIPVQGATAGWLLPLLATGSEITGINTTVGVFKFDDLADGNYLLPKNAAAAANADKVIQWKRTDGAVKEIAANTLVIEGSTGLEKASAAAGGSKAKIVLQPNNIDLDSADFAEFLQRYSDSLSGYFIAALPLGKDISNAMVGTSVIVGVIDSDLTVGPKGNDPSTMTISIVSTTVTFSEAAKTALTAAGVFPAITPDLGTVVPTFVLLEADFAKLSAGTLVLK